MNARKLVLTVLSASLVAGLLTLAARGQAKLPATKPVAGVSTSSAPAAARSPSTQSDRRRVIVVKTVDEFVAAIGSDRIVQMQPGEYRMDKAKRVRLPHVRMSPADADPENEEPNAIDAVVGIHKVKNLRIEGLGKKRVQILNGGKSIVLQLEGADGVELDNLELSQVDENQRDEVLNISSSQRVRITNCRLCGCSWAGLVALSVTDLTMEGCTIDRCKLGIMSVNGCDRLLFKNCTFTANNGPMGLTLLDSEKVRFEGCQIFDNKLQKSLLRVLTSKDIVMKACRIQDNAFTEIATPEKIVEFQKCEISDNGKPSDNPEETHEEASEMGLE